jgi:drug/metabolite transporter (DMT)-like permease
MPKAQTLLVDKVGAWLGLTCAVHCLAMPLVVGVLPLLGFGFLTQQSSEGVLLGAILVTALAGALWGYRRHRELRVVMAFIGAVGLVLISRVWGEHHPLGRALGIVGGLAIAGAHLVSARLCRSCSTDHAHDHDHEHAPV